MKCYNVHNMMEYDYELGKRTMAKPAKDKISTLKVSDPPQSLKFFSSPSKDEVAPNDRLENSGALQARIS